jgi:UDP-N-acetylglucosamine:LPS N-acetylglucosamine transferase
VAKIVHKGKVLKVQRPTKWGYNPLQNLAATVKSFFQSRKVVKTTRFDAIIGSGPGLCVFPMYFARKAGKKVVFIETVNRVKTESKTGRRVYKWADQFFVQWPEQKKHYPKAEYAGRLL